MIVLNLMDDVGPDVLQRLQALTGQEIGREVKISLLFNKAKAPLVCQVATALDNAEISPAEWRHADILAILPSGNLAALSCLAALYHRMQRFPLYACLDAEIGDPPTPDYGYRVVEVISLEKPQKAAPYCQPQNDARRVVLCFHHASRREIEQQLAQSGWRWDLLVSARPTFDRTQSIALQAERLVADFLPVTWRAENVVAVVPPSYTPAAICIWVELYYLLGYLPPCVCLGMEFNGQYRYGVAEVVDIARLEQLKG